LSRTLHRIHTLLEAQQSGSKIKKFFHQGEMSTLLKNCKAGLQQGLDFFQVRIWPRLIPLLFETNMSRSKQGIP
jgi:hypothetical protein